MVARPIDEVRGTALRAEASFIDLRGVRPPPQTGQPVTGVQLAMLPRGPVWQVKQPNGVIRFDARTGALLPPVDSNEARTIADRAYLPSTAITRVTRFDDDAPPVDLRQPRPSWQVRFADGTNIYVDAESGAVLALRTRQWRAFDWMWGLHIMDLGAREDTSHAVLMGFAGLALIGVLVGLVLLPFVKRRKVSDAE